MYDTKGPYQVFLWYRLGKYQENTNRYHTEIPNRDTTLVILFFFVFNAPFDGKNNGTSPPPQVPPGPRFLLNITLTMESNFHLIVVCIYRTAAT